MKNLLEYIIINGEFYGTDQDGQMEFVHPVTGELEIVYGSFAYDDNYFYYDFETEDGAKYLVQGELMS